MDNRISVEFLLFFHLGSATHHCQQCHYIKHNIRPASHKYTIYKITILDPRKNVSRNHKEDSNVGELKLNDSHFR